ncbi:MAG: hypothetical protein N3G78_08585 [Desulfobacterota bacterium]|nr:hypothetical protein [Thermodesulfobacteriota bacterium]
MMWQRSLTALTLALCLTTPLCGWAAGDFEWMAEFNLRAEADMSHFRARLAARFKVGEPLIEKVLSQVAKPAEAYLVFRLGEMSGKPPEIVLERYKLEKGKGWGELAKGLGIKPGSPEFHALKRGSDLYEEKEKRREKTKEKGRAKGKS